MNDCIFIGNFSHIPDGQIIFQMCEAECEIVFFPNLKAMASLC